MRFVINTVIVHLLVHPFNTSDAYSHILVAMSNSVKPQNETVNNVSSNGGYGHSSSLRLENRRFTYNELEKITNNFQRVLGHGGFGYVYDGFLEDGTQVAVKLRSESSNQGAKEFLAEVKFLQLQLIFCFAYTYTKLLLVGYNWLISLVRLKF